MRPQREPKAKEKMRQMQTELQNVSMAVRIMQVSMQQLLSNVQKSDADLSRALETVNELQYRLLAMIKQSGTDVAALDEVASELKLNDYNEASDAEDKAKNYELVNEPLTENHVAIVTTKCLTVPNKSIFRAKFRLQDLSDPKVKETLTGKVIGDKVVVNLNGLEHELEILGVRRLPAPPTEVPAPEAAQPAATA